MRDKLLMMPQSAMHASTKPSTDGYIYTTSTGELSDEMSKQRQMVQQTATKGDPVDDTDLHIRLAALQANGWQTVDVGRDGNCFFRALAKQLRGTEQLHGVAREETIQWMRKYHNELADFAGDVFKGDFDSYVNRMSKEGTYIEGDLEIQSAANACNVCIKLYGRSRDHDRTFSPIERNDETCTVYMVHYQAGQHYAILEPRDRVGFQTTPKMMPKQSSEEDGQANGRSSRRSSRGLIKATPTVDVIEIPKECSEELALHKSRMQPLSEDDDFEMMPKDGDGADSVAAVSVTAGSAARSAAAVSASVAGSTTVSTEVEKQVAFNKRLEPLLTSAEASGVIALTVSESDAQNCAAALTSDWLDGCLNLRDNMGNLYSIRGFNTYPKTLTTHDMDEQRLHTLLVTNKLLPKVRLHLPGFQAMEQQIATWLEKHFKTKVELFEAHALRQGPKTLRSTGFGVHQDNEEHTCIEYTVVVKLTPDEPNEEPSAMRVVGAPFHFEYGPTPGTSGCFRAGLFHASIVPKSEREHLKMAFFFRHPKGYKQHVKSKAAVSAAKGVVVDSAETSAEEVSAVAGSAAATGSVVAAATGAVAAARSAAAVSASVAGSTIISTAAGSALAAGSAAAAAVSTVAVVVAENDPAELQFQRDFQQLEMLYPSAKFEDIRSFRVGDDPPVIKGTWPSDAVNSRVPPFHKWLRDGELDKTSLGAIVYFGEVDGVMAPIHAALESEVLRDNGHAGEWGLYPCCVPMTGEMVLFYWVT